MTTISFQQHHSDQLRDFLNVWARTWVPIPIPMHFRSGFQTFADQLLTCLSPSWKLFGEEPYPLWVLESIMYSSHKGNIISNKNSAGLPSPLRWSINFSEGVTNYHSILNKANAKEPTFKVLKQQLFTHHHPQTQWLRFFFSSLAYYLFRIRTDFYLGDEVIQADISKASSSKSPLPWKKFQCGSITVTSIAVGRLVPNTI